MNPFHAARTILLSALVVLTITGATTENQTNYYRLKSFGSPNPGTCPHTALLLGSDGLLYGTTQSGGAANQGTVFRLGPDGTDYLVLHDFSADHDGKNPDGALVQGRDGSLFGTTVYGGSNRCGTVFTMGPNGDGYAILHDFSRTRPDGQYPYGRLVLDTNDSIYGTTSLRTYFTTNGSRLILNTAPGAVYRLNRDGSGFSFLHSFAANGSEGRNPSGLILGAEGALYGTTQTVSTNTIGRLAYKNSSVGAVFRLNLDGTGFAVWTNIPSSGIHAHLNALCSDPKGLLLGTTSHRTNAESIFSIQPNGSNYKVLHTFLKDGIDGRTPDTQLLLGLDGAFYGTTVVGGTNGAGTIFRLSVDGSSYTILYHFKTNQIDGHWPEDSLVQNREGTLFGTTLRGGLSDEGTVYAINPDGSDYRQLHQFNGFAAEGQLPNGGLTPATNGALYGATQVGGRANGGILFKIDGDGRNYAVLHHFGSANDGLWPGGQLLLGQDAAWYGTTYQGGRSNFGSLFKVQGDGHGYILLHSFSGVSDGEIPNGALAQDAFGMLYGTTAAGGSNDVGTVFALNPDGSGYSILHSYSNALAGDTAYFHGAGNLTFASTSVLYGNGYENVDGNNSGGWLFLIGTNGSGYAKVHSFGIMPGDGRSPSGRLALSGAAWFGTTEFGGDMDAGTIYSMPILAPTLTTQPQSQTMLYGTSASLTVEAAGSPADCQWYFNGTVLADATGPELVLTPAIRAHAGVYRLAVSNAAGIAVSSNAVLTVQVPVKLSGPQTAADGGMEILAAYSDGWPIVETDIPRFQVQSSTNLTDWLTLNGPSVIADGELVFVDREPMTLHRRFYRVLELP